MNYIVVVQKYGRETRTSPMPWIEALRFAQGASVLAQMIGWTRTSAVPGLYTHMDIYYDIYNEGSINIEASE